MNISMIPAFKKVILFGLPILVVVCALTAGLGYYYYQYQQVLKNPTQVGTQEVEQTVKQIARFMDLPAETPTMATVTDITLLKVQPFFANAQNDDKILIFPTERKVILYRPSSKKVINFAPLTINNDSAVQPTESSSDDSQVTVSMAIYNGSDVVGLTNSVQQQMNLFSDVQVVLKENAQRKDYTQTLVVDLKGSLGDVAAKVATAIGGTVGTLPDGERKPETDLLVIAAK